MSRVTLTDFGKGMISPSRTNRLNFPPDAVESGRNVDLSAGLKTREGSSIVSSGSLPAGTVRMLEQVRFPTNETSYLVAQVESSVSPYWEARADGPARFDHSMIWDTPRNRAVVFGGGYGDPCLASYNDTRAYYPSTDTWETLSTTGGTPAVRQGHAAIYDAVGQRMIIYGGAQYLGGTLVAEYSDVWALDLQTLVWSELTCTGTDPGAGYAVGIYRSSTRSLVICKASTVDVYSLDLATNAWTTITRTSGTPIDTNGHSAVYDDAGDRMMLLIPLSESPYAALWYTEFDGVFTQLAAPNNLMHYPYAARAVFYDGKVFSSHGETQTTDDPTRRCLLYDTGDAAWSAPLIEGEEFLKSYHAGVVTPGGDVIVHGGQWLTAGTQNTTFLGRGIFSAGTTSSLYASPTHIPTSEAVFTEIYDLGEGAGTCSVAVLNDRAVITEGVNDVPLVFAGCMAEDASDWAVPKNVLVSPDGANYYDAPEVLDKDPDTVSDMSNIRMQGEIAICLDMPKVEALHITMGTPSSGVPVEAQVYNQTLELNDVTELNRHNLQGAIVQWYRDAATKGHFEGTEIDIDAGPAVDKGGGLVGIPSTDHGLADGTKIRIEGTTNYNGFFTMDATSSVNEIVITHGYVAETFNVGTEKVRRRYTLGSGNDEVDVVAGMRLAFADTEVTILTIAEDGADSQDVTLSEDHVTANVSGIYGLNVIDDALTVNYSASASMVSSFSKTLDDPPFTAPVMVSIRQVIKAADISASGNYVQVTLDFSTLAETPTLINSNDYTFTATIVERSGTTANGTTTPTRLVFQNSSTGVTGTVTSSLTKFTVDETKDYLVCVDVLAIPGSQIGYNSGYGSRVAPSGKTYGIFLKQTLSGGGYYFKVENSVYYPGWGYNIWYAESLQQNVAAGYADYSDQVATLLVSSIQVQTNRSAPTALHVATTTDTDHLPVYFADAFTGITVEQTAAGTSTALHALSFDGRTTWKIFDGAVWREIVRNDGGTWQYKDAAAVWQNAATNDMSVALREAFAVTENQMPGDELSAITPTQFTLSGGPVPKITQYIDFAVGLEVDGSGNIPSVSSYGISFNDSGTTIIEGWSNGSWTSGEGWTDGTAVAEVPLAQSGIISYNGIDPMELDYTVVNGVPGYFIRIRSNGTSPDTSITRILYKAPCQPLANIGDGQPVAPTGFIYVDTSENLTQDFTSEVSDNILTNFSTALVPMATDDKLYVGYPEQFNVLELIPGEDNNKVTSVLSAEYWTGSEWLALTIMDGTAGAGGKTFSGAGKITWEIPSNWKRSIPFDTFLSRAYWVRFSVSAGVTANTAIAEARVYSVPTAIKKHKHAAVWADRVALANRPDAADQVDFSGELAEYQFTGQNSGSYRVGGMDGIVAMSEFSNTLFVWKPGSVHQFTGDGFQSAEAVGRTPINGQAIVKAPMGGGDGDRNGLFFVNRHGAFVSTGLHTDASWNTSRGQGLASMLDWWDANVLPRLDLNYLHRACGEYWPKKNWLLWAVPMILVGSEQTTNNVLIVYDLSLGCWYPPFVFPFGVSAMCTAYEYNGDAPGKLGDVELLVGDYGGRVIRLCNAAVTTDLDTEIQAWIETGWLHHGDPHEQSVIEQVWLFGNSSGSSSVQLTATGRLLANGALREQAPIVKIFPEVTGVTEVGLGFAKGPTPTGNYLKYRLDWTGPTEIYGLTLEGNGIREDTSA